MQWATCAKYKGFLGRVFSKENCEKYHIEYFSEKNFVEFEKLNFRCQSISTFKD